MQNHVMSAGGVSGVLTSSAAVLVSSQSSRAGTQIASVPEAGEELDRRIQALEREWTVERMLECAVALLALGGVVLAVTANRQWLWFSAGVLALLLLAGASTWTLCARLLRHWGVRTQAEIAKEKYALKTLRGDYDRPIPRNSAEPSAAGVLHA